MYNAPVEVKEEAVTRPRLLWSKDLPLYQDKPHRERVKNTNQLYVGQQDKNK